MTLPDFRDNMRRYPALTAGIEHMFIADALEVIMARVGFRQPPGDELIPHTLDRLWQHVENTQAAL